MNLIVVPNLDEFFKTELDKFKPTQSQEVQFYLVNLLTRFSVSSNLFEDSIGQKRIPILIELLSEAENEIKQEEKRLLYRQTGDLSLYTIGFINSIKQPEYYYEFIGKRAYSCAVELSTKSQKELYRELSYDFNNISNLLKKLSNSFKTLKNQELLRTQSQ